MGDQPIYALVITPTIAEATDRWHRERFGRPAPGMPPHLLGYHWAARDVVHGVDEATGYEPTAEEALAAAQWSIFEPEPDPTRDQPEDPALELVRRAILYDQDRDWTAG